MSKVNTKGLREEALKSQVRALCVIDRNSHSLLLRLLGAKPFFFPNLSFNHGFGGASIQP